MHRNTLIYRLEQIEKRTGLDLRQFEDAMTFKIASMVMNYLYTEGIYHMNDALYEQLVTRKSRPMDLRNPYFCALPLS